jgi:hypothetical protein
MALKQVLSYSAVWGINQHTGTIQLNLDDHTGFGFPVGTPGEMEMLIDILRNEKPVHFDPAFGSVTNPLAREKNRHPSA